MQFKGSRSGGPLHWEKEGGGPQQLVAPLIGQRCSQASSPLLVLFKVLLCSSSSTSLPLSAGWVLALGTKGVWVSPELGVPARELLCALPAWPWNLPGEPRWGEELRQPLWELDAASVGPHCNTAAFHHSAPPCSAWCGWEGALLCAAGVFCACAWVSADHSAGLEWLHSCLPAFVIPLGSRILDSPGGSSGMSEFLKHLGSPGLWLEWMWL